MNDFDYRGRRFIEFSSLKGKTFTEVVRENFKASKWDDEVECIKFVDTDGKVYRMLHDQDCCESVTIEEIVGDLSNLVGHPILQADEEFNSGNEDDYETGDTSQSWTFYNIRTVMGNVNIRWYGTSNGYYSESVSVYEFKTEAS